MNFLMNPEESAGCHQTLSAHLGSGDETMLKKDPALRPNSAGLALEYRPSLLLLSERENCRMSKIFVEIFLRTVENFRNLQN